MIKTNKIMPYTGVDEFKLMSTLDEVRLMLKNNGVAFSQEIWPNKGYDPEVPWTIIRVKNGLSLFFAFDKLWKIVCGREFGGSLPNGITLGMLMEDALAIDPSLQYDDWEEYYSSECGYWIEDSVKTKQVETITVFVKSALDDDAFYSYEWAK